MIGTRLHRGAWVGPKHKHFLVKSMTFGFIWLASFSLSISDTRLIRANELNRRRDEAIFLVVFLILFCSTELFLKQFTNLVSPKRKSKMNKLQTKRIINVSFNYTGKCLLKEQIGKLYHLFNCQLPIV